MSIDAASVADLATATMQEKHRRRSRQARLAVVFVGCILLLDAVFGERGFFQRLKAREELLGAERDISALKRENAALRAEVHRLQADPATLERVARQELGLMRPGEILVVLTDVK